MSSMRSAHSAMMDPINPSRNKSDRPIGRNRYKKKHKDTIQQQKRRGRVYNNNEEQSSNNDNNKIRRSKNKMSPRNSSNKRNSKSISSSSPLMSPLPSLTTNHDMTRPFYFSCRHTYEETLMEEIQLRLNQENDHDNDTNHRINNNNAMMTLSSPCPGLVRVDNIRQNHNQYSKNYDFVYALQCIPNSVVISATSIKSIAKEIYSALVATDGSDTMTEYQEQLRGQLRMAERGCLSIHALVPGMCIGQPKPALHQRSLSIAKELSSLLSKTFPAARKRRKEPKNAESDVHELISESEIVAHNEDKWILQIMMADHNIAIASLAKSEPVLQSLSPSSTITTNTYWPNYHRVLGLAKCDIDFKMPSSAYRKLLESLDTLGFYPNSDSIAVDLGACPGGWTAVLRKIFDCEVIAVDRSKLDPSLMKDDRVTFIKGDAFTYKPPFVLDGSTNEEEDNGNESSNDRNLLSKYNTWMVSDVIAYPERIIELINRWCGGHWATYMIITMKFQGEKPSWQELDEAIELANHHGYDCRAKHFFNNKNEVSLMIAERRNDAHGKEERIGHENLEHVHNVIQPMYPVSL